MKIAQSVIPAKAGIQTPSPASSAEQALFSQETLDSRLHGNDDFRSKLFFIRILAFVCHLKFVICYQLIQTPLMSLHWKHEIPKSETLNSIQGMVRNDTLFCHATRFSIWFI